MNINILSYSVDPTGATPATPSINQAIRDCAQSGGGTVEFPAGNYLCGTIDLLSNVYLHLHPGATILGSEDIADYHGTQRGCSWCWMGAPEALAGLTSKNPCPALIVADRQTNCGITGAGKIDGRRSFPLGYTEKKGRPFLIVLSECSFVTLRDVTLTNPGMFTVYGLNSSDMTIDNVTILTADSANGDGLDFDGGKRISISNCHIDAGDDGIGLKTLTPDQPCEDFTITGCHIRSKHWGAVRIGPESAGAMRRINITNCCFYDSGDGLKFQLTQNADFEDINVSNITMDRVLRPIFFTKNRYNMSANEPSVRPAVGAFRRVQLSNITATLREDSVFPNMTIYAGNYISALPSDSIDDITLDHVHMIAPGGGSQADAERTEAHGEMYDFWGMYPEHLINVGTYPAAVLYLRHAKGIRMYDCIFETATPDARAAIAAEDVDGLRLVDCIARGCDALLRHYRCEPLILRDTVGAVRPFTQTQATAWEAESARSQAMEAYLQTLAETVEAARWCAPLLSREITLPSPQNGADTGELTFRAKAGERLWLLIPNIAGNFAVTLNQKEIAKHAFPPLYTFPIPFAVALGEHLADGENTLRICPAQETASRTVTLQILSEN